jgi:hypothetical protein
VRICSVFYLGQLSKMEGSIVPPTVDVLLRLSKRYGRSVDWILTGEPPNFSSNVSASFSSTTFAPTPGGDQLLRQP